MKALLHERNVFAQRIPVYSISLLYFSALKFRHNREHLQKEDFRKDDDFPKRNLSFTEMSKPVYRGVDSEKTCTGSHWTHDKARVLL